MVIKVRGQRYLNRQGRRYWARYRVPKDVRSAFDEDEHWVNLTTDDEKTAVARCHRATSAFRSRVLEARGRVGVVEDDRLTWRKLKEASDGEDDGGVVVDAVIQEASNRYVKGGYAAVRKAADRFHDGSDGDALEDMGGPKAQAFIDTVIHGRKPLSLFIEPWQAVRVTEVETKTAAMDKTAVLRFAESFALLDGVNKAAVASWIEKRKADVSAATVQREITGLRSFWRYLQTRDEVPADADPFAGQRFKDRRKDRQRVRRTSFTAAEVSALYAEASAGKHNDQQLADLIASAAYTGARREELCSLAVEDVDQGWITIKDAKTDAGNRVVPVHPALAPLFKRLKGKRTTGYVFADLGEDQWGNRGDALGKRFTRLKAALGHGPEKTLHSIRHTFQQLLRARRDASTDLIADLLGHKLATMTGGTYGTPEARRKLLPAALAKLRYPKPL